MAFTNEQLRAINTRNKNLLVSAAAGSGKTTVLVERIIGRVLDEDNPVDIDRMLVMTFTKAAAEQMKEKILDAIEKRYPLSIKAWNSCYWTIRFSRSITNSYRQRSYYRRRNDTCQEN